MFMNIFVIFFLPTLLFLGSWQVVRGLEKQDIWEKYSLNQSKAPINISKISDGFQENFSYRTVFLRGSYVDKSVWLDNRIYRQTRGYEVFTPFITQDGRAFLINRGWTDKINTEQSRDASAEIQIEGIYAPFKRSGLSLEKTSSSNGRVFQELTLEEMQIQYSDLDLDNSLIQISPASAGALEPIWSPSVFKAQRHWAYAAQWYGLFVVLLIGYIIYGNKRGREANEE